MNANLDAMLRFGADIFLALLVAAVIAAWAIYRLRK